MESIVSAVISIALEVKKRCDTVKANKSQCTSLGVRVSILATQVEKIPAKAILSKAEGLQQLQGVLESALELVSKYKELGFLSRLVRCNGDSEQFKELHERLNQSSSDLSLVCAFDSAAQQVALQEDNKANERLLEEMLAKHDQTHEMLKEVQASLEFLKGMKAPDPSASAPSSARARASDVPLWFIPEKAVEFIGAKGRYGEPKPIGKGAFAQVFKVKYCGETLAQKQLLEEIFEVRIYFVLLKKINL